LLRHQAEGNVQAQIEIYGRLTERMRRAGVAQVAVTSIAGHFCIEAFKAVSPVPVIDLLDVIKLEVKRRGLRRVGLLGTRVVMQSRFYGVLDGVEVIPPEDDLTEVHEAYVAMASAGVATAVHREVFRRAGMSLTRTHGCESILLAGTDLALVFGRGGEPGFDILDCAEAHAVAIANAAMTNQDAT
jgi:aspartate racemase